MASDDPRDALVVDDRAGFYMVPTAAIAKARARLSGAHLAEALAGLACLARESFAQRGASREEAQVLEATLDALSRRVLGVSRARALRITENLVDAGALVKEADRADGVRRLPTRLTFVDLAVSFAYVSGPAFRSLVATSEDGRPPLGPLALYVTLVALGGEQRDDFPDGNRRIARASQPELAKLSGLSVTSVKRALAVLKRAELVLERPQPNHALRTKAVYRLVDPGEHAGQDAAPGEGLAAPPRREGASRPVLVAAHPPVAADAGDVGQATAEPGVPADGPQPNRRQTEAEPSSDRDGTDGQAVAEPWTGRRGTDDGPRDDAATGPGRTHGQAGGPSCARVEHVQRTADQQISQTPDARVSAEKGGEVDDEVDVLVQAFLAWVRDALGDRRAGMLYDAAGWQASARRLLEHYELERILAGVERLGRDALLADKATTLPAFEQIAERAIARAAADRRLAAHRDDTPSASPDSAAGRMSWAAAHDMLRQAVGAFGGAGEQRALAHLQAQDQRLAAFVRDVGWRTVARSDAAMNDVKFAYLQYRPADDQESAA